MGGYNEQWSREFEAAAWAQTEAARLAVPGEETGL